MISLYVWALGISLGLEHTERYIIGPLTQWCVANQWLTLDCLDIIYVWLNGVSLGLKDSDRRIIGPLTQWFPAYHYTESRSWNQVCMTSRHILGLRMQW